MALRSREHGEAVTLTPAVIFDVDGTLCDISGVRHYITDDTRHKNFEKFHAAASFCPPNEAALTLAHLTTMSGLTNLVVTGRKERWRYRTASWLRKYNVEHAHLMMRPDQDDRPDYEVKADILTRIRSRYRVTFAVDDNPAIIDLWQREGIPVVVIPGWQQVLAPTREEAVAVLNARLQAIRRERRPQRGTVDVMKNVS